MKYFLPKNFFPPAPFGHDEYDPEREWDYEEVDLDCFGKRNKVNNNCTLGQFDGILTKSGKFIKNDAKKEKRTNIK